MPQGTVRCVVCGVWCVVLYITLYSVVVAASVTDACIASVVMVCATTGFGQQAWFGQLFDFGLPQENGQPTQHAPDDVDQHVVPALVGKVVLPIVLQRVCT